MSSTRTNRQEHDSICSMLKRKNNSLPRTVQYWLYFKAHILMPEYVRLALMEQTSSSSSGSLTKREFISFVKEYAPLNKWGPRFCRQKTSADSKKRRLSSVAYEIISVSFVYYQMLFTGPLRVQESSLGGLGVFMQEKQLTITSGDRILPQYLWGACVEILEEDYDELHENAYPSLYEARGCNYILVGPLSLVNHSCGSTNYFTQPCSKHHHQQIEEFDGISFVYVRVTGEDDYSLKHGDEILANYRLQPDEQSGTTMVLGRQCGCPAHD